MKIGYHVSKKTYGLRPTQPLQGRVQVSEHYGGRNDSSTTTLGRMCSCLGACAELIFSVEDPQRSSSSKRKRLEHDVYAESQFEQQDLAAREPQPKQMLRSAPLRRDSRDLVRA